MARFRTHTASVAVAALVLSAVPIGIADAGAPPPAAASDVERELTEARQLMERKDWTGALVELKRALRRDRRNADVHHLMGYSYRKSGQLDDAFDSYRTALRLEPNHRGAHEYIGEAYLQLNQPAKAREHLTELKRICGESCEQYRDLARAIAAWQPPATTAKK